MAKHDDPDGLPVVVSPLSAIEVVARLDEAARRGKMAGFAKGAGGADGVLFTVTDFGTPLESVLIARAGSSGAGCELRFERRLRPLWPWVLVALTLLSVWPGVWVTESVLTTYFPGTNLYVAWWYLPLTVVGGVWGLWSVLRKSIASGRAEGAEIVGKISGLVAGHGSK